MKGRGHVYLPRPQRRLSKHHSTLVKRDKKDKGPVVEYPGAETTAGCQIVPVAKPSDVTENAAASAALVIL